MKRSYLLMLWIPVLMLMGCKNVFLNDLDKDEPEKKDSGEITYRIKISESIINGTILAKPGSAPAGTAIILQVSPAPGYRLQSNSLKYRRQEGVAVIDETTRSFILPAGDVVVTAEFEALPADNYSVSVQGGSVNNGIVMARPEYGSPGTPVSLVVIPDPGYRYKEGTLQYNSTFVDNPEKQFTLPNYNVTISAQFEALPGSDYTVRAGNPANGRLLPKPAHGAPGTEIYLEAIPDPGYVLKRGSLKYRGASGERPVNEISRTFVLPAEHVLVNGEFEVLPMGNYTVGTPNLTGGRVLPEPGFGKAGDTIFLWVIPNPGFIFKEESLVYTDASGSHKIDTNTRSFTMPADHVTVRAEFAPAGTGEYTVRTENIAHGQILTEPEYGKAGTPISLRINPDPGYRLRQGSLEYIGSSGGTTLIEGESPGFFLPADHITVQAEFEALAPGNYTIQTDYIPHGYITPLPAFGTPNTPVYLWVTPDPGYILAYKSLEYQTLPDLRSVAVNDSTRTFELPMSHIRVSGKFEKAPFAFYTLRTEPTAHGRINLDPEYQQSGKEVNIDVTPDPGYRLKPGSLRYLGTAGASKVIDRNQFIMPREHLTIYGEFESLTYKVAIDPAIETGGNISASITTGITGTPVVLKINPKNGNRFVPGSLKYTTSAGKVVSINEQSLWFAMPAADIVISARFEPFAALKNLKINGVFYNLTGGETDYILRIPARERKIRFDFTVDKDTIANPASGKSYDLRLFENPPVRYTLESADGITRTTYNFTIIRELIRTETVPAGTFQRDGDRRNLSTISEAFKMGQHEVTQDEWREVMGYARGDSMGGSYPVSRINWYEALMFCNKLSILEKKTPVYEVNGEGDPQKWPAQKSGWIIQVKWNADGYRLPTEAEWLWAAMGADYYNKSRTNTEGYAYTQAGKKLGFSLFDVAWFDSNAHNQTWPVKQKRPNELGLYDISGNVGEWCWDWYNGNAGYDIQGKVTDYTGPVKGTYRVVRGGSYASPEGTIALTFRGGNYPMLLQPFANPATEINQIGLRVLCKK
ncbi:MAG: SUMF1/EgtB/PvdO family nonheme iron enzyme [Treponema sp.]|jgi:formylglycine-generating enzyme required for sulfatase activity|nr:SUMF1/EgtB/PvdO family nonheme iron enzyme [Treponema sp.]